MCILKKIKKSREASSFSLFGACHSGVSSSFIPLPACWQSRRLHANGVTDTPHFGAIIYICIEKLSAATVGLIKLSSAVYTSAKRQLAVHKANLGEVIAMAYDRSCNVCGVMLGRDSFSTNQWGKGIGVSRCHACVHGWCNIGGENEAPKSKRQNVSTTSSIDQCELDNPFAEGSFRWVGKGQYTSGVRNGQCAIHKWFKSGTVFEATFFAKDIKANDKATHIIQQFNCARFLKEAIRINQPEVWTFTDGCPQCGQKVLVEPFIDEYQKFNSNSGCGRHSAVAASYASAVPLQLPRFWWAVCAL